MDLAGDGNESDLVNTAEDETELIRGEEELELFGDNEVKPDLIDVDATCTELDSVVFVGNAL